MFPFGPFPANYQAFLPPPAPVPSVEGVRATEGDRFERKTEARKQRPGEQTEEPKHPWYVSAGKEIVINGLTIAASIAGGMVGGVFGAMAAGSLTSAGLGILEQKFYKKQAKIDWKSVGIDGALGLIPGTVAEAIAKNGSRVLARSTGKTFDIGAQNSVKRGVVIGATDGLVLGSVGGFTHSAYDSYKKDGRVNWTEATKDAAKSAIPGIIGGGLGGGAVMRSRLNKPAE